jgi:SAM-dependent methyltransferase
MVGNQAPAPDYGNWVSTKFIWFPFVVALPFAVAASHWPWFALPAVALFACGAYFAYARAQFSRVGADLQNKIQKLLLDALQWDGSGQALDIGCGSGALAVALAKLFPSASVIGVDTWGRSWEYSLDTCEANALTEEVADRVSFQRASATALPFDDETFDAVVSNLTFHEVRRVEKRAVLHEALRVLRAGGVFAFQDLFLWKRVYGGADEVIDAVRECGVEQVTLLPTRDFAPIPRMLKVPFMLGTLAIVKGIRRGGIDQGV